MLGNYLGGMLRWGDASTNAAICGGTHAGQFIFTEPGHACVAAAACCVVSTGLGMRGGKSCSDSATHAVLTTLAAFPCGILCECACPNTDLVASILSSLGAIGNERLQPRHGVNVIAGMRLRQEMR